MSYKFSNDKPIFMQIEEILKSKIISKEILLAKNLNQYESYPVNFKLILIPFKMH